MTETTQPKTISYWWFLFSYQNHEGVTHKTSRVAASENVEVFMPGEILRSLVSTLEHYKPGTGIIENWKPITKEQYEDFIRGEGDGTQ